jgi:CRISPR-associated protein Csy2
MKHERFKAVLLLPRLRVQNANAISSPLTWGFPPPSAFTGFVHALQRRLNAQGQGLRFGSVGIVCHQFEPQTYRPPGRYTQVFSLTRNPLDKDGNTQAIVEEGRTHLEVSLLITVLGDDLPANGDTCAAQVLHQAEGMRLAGGSIVPQPQRSKHPALWVDWPDNSQEQNSAFAKLRPRLAPGFVLLSRAQLLADHLAQIQQTHAQASALDALLDLCALHHTPPPTTAPQAENSPDTSEADATPSDVAGKADDDAVITAAHETEQEAEQVTDPKSKDWRVSRRKPGWLVPLPMGYAAISPLYAPGEVKNARDNDTPFRFVESVLSLGEWVGPHRIKALQDLLWVHHAQPDAGLYLTHNGAAIKPPAASISV